MTNSASRLITLILLLQKQPNQKAAALAQKLGVSIRSVHRYLIMLEEMGIPIYSERGPYGGFSLVRGYRMPPLIFTPEEAAAVYLGASLTAEMWGHLYREAAEGALAKLNNVLPDEQLEEIAWARRSLVVTGIHRADMNSLTPYLEKLRRAVRESRRVWMLYHSQNRPQPIGRELEPYALVHSAGWWYVIGYCRLREEVRLFRVDRIRELRLEGDTFQLPQDFDARQFMDRQDSPQQLTEVRIRFIPAAAHFALANRSSWASVEEQPDGSVVAAFSTPDLIWAAGTVMSYGPVVEALDPPELRKILFEWVRSIEKKYRADDLLSLQEEVSL
jgi:predicted DNA-binding transcriptional regulator YafY